MGTKLMGIGVSAVLLAGALAMPVQALADESGFESTIIGSTPGMLIGGVASGGAAWKVREGKVTIEDGGRLKAEISGLLLVATNTVGPVLEVAASVVCGGTGGMVVATSEPVGLGAAGNAEIHADLTLLAPCAGPVVLIRNVNATTNVPGAFIALSGIIN
jgi:hypothetical protein